MKPSSDDICKHCYAPLDCPGDALCRTCGMSQKASVHAPSSGFAWWMVPIGVVALVAVGAGAWWIVANIDKVDWTTEEIVPVEEAVAEYLREIAHDPSSVEVVRCAAPKGDTVVCDFRAKNRLGARVISTGEFTMSGDRVTGFKELK